MNEQELIAYTRLVWQQLKTNLLLSKWAERSDHYLRHMPVLVDGISMGYNSKLGGRK